MSGAVTAIVGLLSSVASTVGSSYVITGLLVNHWINAGNLHGQFIQGLPVF